MNPASSSAGQPILTDGLGQGSAATGLIGAADVREIPTGVAIFIGVAILYLVLKTGKLLLKLFLCLVAIALFLAAYWWHVRP